MFPWRVRPQWQAIAKGPDDTFYASKGEDYIDGGAGSNTMDYSLPDGIGINIDLNLQRAIDDGYHWDDDNNSGTAALVKIDTLKYPKNYWYTIFRCNKWRFIR